MKERKVALILILVCLIFVGFTLWPRNHIGITYDDVEDFIREEEQFDQSWQVVTDVMEPYYALFFYNADYSNHQYFIFEEIKHNKYVRVSTGRSLIELEALDSDLYTDGVYVHLSYNKFEAWSVVFSDRIKDLQAEKPFIALSSSPYLYAFDRYKKLIEY